MAERSLKLGDSWAEISACGAYRYALGRRIYPRRGPERTLLWVMLNPSVADAVEDDHTIRRCRSFADAWGFNHVVVANLFAFRATDPKALWSARDCGVDVVGPYCDEWVNRLASYADTVVAAWGRHAVNDLERATYVRKLLMRRHDVHALGFTRCGRFPLHPLMQPGTAELIPWRY